MKDGYRLKRGEPRFWEDLGLEEQAANSAALCFPERWWRIRRISPYSQEYFSQSAPKYLDPFVASLKDSPNTDCDCAEQYLSGLGVQQYTTKAWHPAFWAAQGHDFDDMARRAVVVNTFLNLNEEANSQLPQPDPTADVMMAMMVQSRPQLSPPRNDDYFDDEPLPQEWDWDEQEPPPPPPFNSSAFPRLDP